jgi:hypothetical protein
LNSPIPQKTQKYANNEKTRLEQWLEANLDDKTALANTLATDFSKSGELNHIYAALSGYNGSWFSAQFQDIWAYLTKCVDIADKVEIYSSKNAAPEDLKQDLKNPKAIYLELRKKPPLLVPAVSKPPP